MRLLLDINILLDVAFARPGEEEATSKGVGALRP